MFRSQHRLLWFLALACVARAQCPFAAAARGASERDHARAQQSRPRPGLSADGAPAIRAMLNEHLSSGPLALPRPRPAGVRPRVAAGRDWAPLA